MSTKPHWLLEFVVAALIPASRHEEILGDLSERYTSPWRYASDALQVVPAVLFTQMLRATRRRQRQATMSPRRRMLAQAPAVAGRLTAWLGSTRAVGGRSVFGLLGTTVWLTIASILNRRATDRRLNGPCAPHHDR